MGNNFRKDIRKAIAKTESKWGNILRNYISTGNLDNDNLNKCALCSFNELINGTILHYCRGCIVGMIDKSCFTEGAYYEKFISSYSKEKMLIELSETQEVDAEKLEAIKEQTKKALEDICAFTKSLYKIVDKLCLQYDFTCVNCGASLIVRTNKLNSINPPKVCNCGVPIKEESKILIAEKYFELDGPKVIIREEENKRVD